MKKSISIILAVILILSTIFAGCSSKPTNEPGETTDGLESAQNEFAIDTVDVTNEKGEKVTDANGEVVTTEVVVELSTNKKGETIAIQIDENGEHVTNNKGKDVTYTYTTVPAGTTSKTQDDPTQSSSSKTTVVNPTDLPTVPSTKPTTATTTMKPSSEEIGTTSSELTTIKREKEKVPSTGATGEKVSFSNEDQQTIKQMLEVPYLYNESYENTDSVPIEIATHAAIWMLQREAFNTTSYASSTVVLDLFKYFAQTVVSFKTKCNDAKNENITYTAATDTFVVKSFEAPTHSVKLDRIEYLGNNNYYKVTGTVSGTSKANKVVAVIQKNRLDSSLGFSIKALKWTK